jgi:hypothetical protein
VVSHVQSFLKVHKRTDVDRRRAWVEQACEEALPGYSVHIVFVDMAGGHWILIESKSFGIGDLTREHGEFRERACAGS